MTPKKIAKKREEPVLLGVEAGVLLEAGAVLALTPPQLLDQLLRQQELLRGQRASSLQDSASERFSGLFLEKTRLHSVRLVCMWWCLLCV